MTDGPTVPTAAAAKALNVTKSTLLRWMRAGIVTPVDTTVGGHHRWDVDELRRQLRARTGDVVTGASADLPQRPAVITAIVTSDLGVLVGKRNDGKPPWTFIAGENEPLESPADTIVREVKEETGMEVKAGAILGERVHPKTGRHMVYVAATPTRGTEVFVGDEEELAEVRWVSLAELDSLMGAGNVFAPVHDHLTETIS